MLAQKYGKNKQLISGIHYNFSLDDKFLKSIYKCINPSMEFNNFKTELYLKICRNFMQYRWFLIYLLGAFPVLHKSYFQQLQCSSGIDNKDYIVNKNCLSIRNSSSGYKNDKDYNIRYSSVANYVSEINRLVDNGDLISQKEFYNPIRLKSISTTLEGLEKSGIDYLEIRLVDINPFSKIGISKGDMYTIHLFLLYCLLKEDISLNNDIGSINAERVAIDGLNEDLKLVNLCGEEKSIKEMAKSIIKDIERIISMTDREEETLNDVVVEIRNRFVSTKNTKAYNLLMEIEELGYIDFHLKSAKKYAEMSRIREYNLRGYEELELSTQILLKAAIKRGIKFEILDRKENFIKLEKNGHIEYIKQATKTSLDKYVTVLMMENKLVTNKILKQQNIMVPKGHSFISVEEALDGYELYSGLDIVIKPNTTNHGIGISILKGNYSKDDYINSVKYALQFDSTILIEEFIEGKEYRFLIIDDKVVGILHRVPANVIGDGINSIKYLVEEKNKSSLRGKDYRTPLEKIELGEVERTFLRLQGIDFDYIPQNGEKIYLREKSNISTGGDSIDYTGKLHESYSEVAIDCVKKVEAKICGVDMIINDIYSESTDDNYSIIELNFNPAMHMHCYPYEGVNRNIEDALLDALGF
mgnify:CR=1 FL=1